MWEDKHLFAIKQLMFPTDLNLKVHSSIRNIWPQVTKFSLKITQCWACNYFGSSVFTWNKVMLAFMLGMNKDFETGWDFLLDSLISFSFFSLCKALICYLSAPSSKRASCLGSEEQAERKGSNPGLACFCMDAPGHQTAGLTSETSSPEHH